MDKAAIIHILNEISILLELKGENRFKCIAYSNAARTLENLQDDLGTLIREGKLGEVKGIGSALTEKITELHQTGKLPYYDELKSSFPETLLECLKVPGLGPKKLKVLWEKLEIDSVGDLKLACERGGVAKLEGFGEKTQAKFLEGIAHLDKYRGQFLFTEAISEALPILKALKACPTVKQVETAGSSRRKKELVRDLDFLVATDQPETVMDLFTTLPGIEQVTNKGKTKSSVILASGIQADVRCVTSSEYPFALMYFTGSKEHNIALRQRAIQKQLKLNEYGLFDVTGGGEKPTPCKDEKAIYQKLGLDYIEPELREDMGEIEAAEHHQLPRLIEPKDIHGTFHCHTVWSDGHHSIEDMARGAIALGWSYLGISDHSKSSFVANGLDEKRLKAQRKEIAEINQKFKDEGLKFKIFSGSEVDILGEGNLDFPDEIMADLDFVVASIHQRFSSDEATQTARVIRAISNPYVTMLGHATGRLLLSRESYKIDLNAVIEAAAANKTILELNCTPTRMELDWRHWKRAKEKGVMCSINPDAHSVPELNQVYDGVGVARKGWLTAGDVLNSRTLAEVEHALRRK